jgi:hypothetical protein
VQPASALTIQQQCSILQVWRWFWLALLLCWASQALGWCCCSMVAAARLVIRFVCVYQQLQLVVCYCVMSSSPSLEVWQSCPLAVCVLVICGGASSLRLLNLSDCSGQLHSRLCSELLRRCCHGPTLAQGLASLLITVAALFIATARASVCITVWLRQQPVLVPVCLPRHFQPSQPIPFL